MFVLQTLRQGYIGKFEVCEKTLENDPVTKLPKKITQQSVLPNTNIQIPYTWSVRIEEHEQKVDSKTGISNRLKFQSKEELEKDKNN